MESYVVTSPCIGVKDAACTKICPVECFYDDGDMLVIRPDDYINCGLCVVECPVSAIFRDDEVPAVDKSFIERNSSFFEDKNEDEIEAQRMVV